MHKQLQKKIEDCNTVSLQHASLSQGQFHYGFGKVVPLGPFPSKISLNFVTKAA